MPDTKILVASHNIMRGDGAPTLHQLSGKYDRIIASLPRPIDVLCLQEQRRHDRTNLAPLLRWKLGKTTGVHFDNRMRREVKRHVADFTTPHVFPDSAVLWNGDRLSWIRKTINPMLRISRYDIMGRIFAVDEPMQRFSVGVRLRLGGGKLFDVTSFHLDSWGGNGFKQEQLQSVIDGLDAHIGWDRDGNPVTNRGIFCGDTNIYTPFWIPSKRLQLGAFHRILGEVGLTDPANTPTHDHLRTPKNSLSDRIIHAAARAKLLARCRFDTVAVRDLPILYHGVVETPWSDHDFVWAIIDVG